MKAFKPAKKLLSRLIKHKRLVILGSATLSVLLIGITSYAYHHQNTTKVTPTSSKISVSMTEKPPTDQAEPSAKVDPKSSAQTAPAVTPPIQQPKNTVHAATTQQSTADRRASLRPTPTPPIFTAGRITTSTVCYTNFYAYSLGTAMVSANIKSPGSFSWRIELSNGDIYRQSSDSIPYGSSVAPDFPSTPGFPGSFGYIMYPPDGLKARFVITSPNYSTGAWSDPVPIGSGTSCHASPSYISPEIQYEN